jgi:hypothetical protein
MLSIESHCSPKLVFPEVGEGRLLVMDFPNSLVDSKLASNEPHFKPGSGSLNYP